MPAVPVTPAPAAEARAASAPRAKSAKSRKPPQKTVASELGRLRNSGAITAAQYATYNSSFNAALGLRAPAAGYTRHRARGGDREPAQHRRRRKAHLRATAGAVRDAERNREWWTTGPLLSSGQYVEFSGSQLVWEYYAGQGIELQVLATFGKADGLYTGGPSRLRADAPGALRDRSRSRSTAPAAWCGSTTSGSTAAKPPWTSAMSQGTGIEALTRASEAFRDSSYLQLAHEALPVFTAPPPVGVRVPTRARRPLRAVHVHAGHARSSTRSSSR